MPKNITSSGNNFIAMDGTCLDRLLKQRRALRKPCSAGIPACSHDRSRLEACATPVAAVYDRRSESAVCLGGHRPPLQSPGWVRCDGGASSPEDFSVVGTHLACALNARPPIGRRQARSTSSRPRACRGAAPLPLDGPVGPAGGRTARSTPGPTNPELGSAGIPACWHGRSRLKACAAPVAAVYDRRSGFGVGLGGHRPPLPSSIWAQRYSTRSGDPRLEACATSDDRETGAPA